MAFKEKFAHFQNKSGIGPKALVLVFVLVVIAFVLGRIAGPEGKYAEHVDHADHTAESAEEKTQWWTCSMHPQVQREEPGLCPICNMELIPLEEDDEDKPMSLRQLVVSEEAKALMDVEVAPVERRFVEAKIRMVGKIDYDETKLEYITAWFPGRLDKLYVDYTGVTVNKGDHMVYMYSPELISAQEELLQAIEAARNMEKSELGVMQDMASGTVEAAREKLRLWGLSSEQIKKIEETGEVTDHMTINSPTSGIVIHKNALEGMYVKTGTKIYTIADLSEVWVKLDAYESDLEWLRYGQEIEFTTISFPGTTFKGTISFIDPILNEKTRTVKVRVNVENPDGKLKPGMFVKAIAYSKVAGGGKAMDPSLAGKWICPMHPEIIKDTAGKCDICEMPLVTTESLGYASTDPAEVEKPLIIPVSAALVTGKRAVVYVQLPDTEKPTFVGKEIVLGPRAGDYYLVRHGLEEGEKVVVNGQFKIDSSLQIQAKPSMMTPEGAAGAGMHDHGHKDGEKESGEKIDNGLPAVVNHQMKIVIDRAKEAQKAVKSEDIDRIRSAFVEFGNSLEEVDTDALSTDNQLLWMEYNMRLGNDAIIGSDAETMVDAKDAAESLRGDIRSFANKFGLTSMLKQQLSEREKISVKFRDQLANVYESYFGMQEALADDNAAKAVKAAKNMSKAIESTDMKLLSGIDYDVWMENASRLKEILEKFVDDKDIEIIRTEFHKVSERFAAIAKHFGSAVGEPVYVAHCPMAFENAGADWLQSDQDILNPYFGASMLKCGSIEEVISIKEIWEETDE